MKKAARIALGAWVIDLAKIHGSIEALLYAEEIELRALPKLLETAEYRDAAEAMVSDLHAAADALQEAYDLLRDAADR